MSYGNYGLIAVDCQYDFLPGGVLEVPDGDQVLTPIFALTQDATLVVASRDWHPDNHCSFSDRPEYHDFSWPPHCVQNTKGAKLHPSVRKRANFVISKGMNRNEEAYSAFVGKTLRPVLSLEEILQRSPIQTVVVAGLALDYCVRYTALDANSLGYRTVVPLDATRPVAEETGREALAQLKRAGVEIVDHFT